MTNLERVISDKIRIAYLSSKIFVLGIYIDTLEAIYFLKIYFGFW